MTRLVFNLTIYHTQGLYYYITGVQPHYIPHTRLVLLHHWCSTSLYTTHKACTITSLVFNLTIYHTQGLYYYITGVQPHYIPHTRLVLLHHWCSTSLYTTHEACTITSPTRFVLNQTTKDK